MNDTYPEFLIRVPGRGYFVHRGRHEWDVRPGVRAATWKRRESAEKWLPVVREVFPSAFIVDNSVPTA